MKTLFLLGLLALVRSTLSATSSASTSSQTSSAPAATHTVTVGVNGFSFSPTTVTANVGDTIEYTFYPANHSVARAEYGLPCIPYENTGPNKVGFWSGFYPVEKVTDNLPTFSIKVNDTNPIFFYCAAPQACLPDGMIGVINPNATQTFDNQALFVKNATLQLAPGEQNPTEGGSTPSATPAASVSSSGLGGGAIAGIVVGVLAVIALAGLAFYLCGRNRSLASVLRYSQPPRPQNSDNIPQIPYQQSPTAQVPYSPGFSPQKAPIPSPNPHESWQTTSTAVPNRTQSPETISSPGMMSPQHFSQGYGGYNPIENPGNVLYGGQTSPGHGPWPPGSFNQAHYSQVPQQHQEMATGQEGTSLRQSAGVHQDNASYNVVPQEPVELDARSAVPETPGAAPPQYASNRFSFREGQDAPPGVEKVLRD